MRESARRPNGGRSQWRLRPATPRPPGRCARCWWSPLVLAFGDPTAPTSCHVPRVGAFAPGSVGVTPSRIPSCRWMAQRCIPWRSDVRWREDGIDDCVVLVLILTTESSPIGVPCQVGLATLSTPLRKRTRTGLVPVPTPRGQWMTALAADTRSLNEFAGTAAANPRASRGESETRLRVCTYARTARTVRLSLSVART